MEDYITVFYERSSDIMTALFQHIYITGMATILGCLVAIPLAIFLAKTNINWLQSIVFTVTNIFQTIPSLAMLAIFIPILGIGLKPAVTALFLYSLLPILRNTYAAFESIDSTVIESAKGMGYNTLQRLVQIELPLALPYIMSGIRLTTVYIINWTTLATLIGAGGLGQLIVGGMAVNNRPLIFAAAILAMVLALVVDYLFSKFEGLFSRQSQSKDSTIQMEGEV